MNLRFQMCPATHLVSCYIGKELMDYFGLFGLLDYYRRFFVLGLGFTFLPTLHMVFTAISYLASFAHFRNRRTHQKLTENNK